MTRPTWTISAASAARLAAIETELDNEDAVDTTHAVRRAAVRG